MILKFTISGFIDDDRDRITKFLGSFAANLAFSIIGLVSLVFIKMKNELEKPLYIIYLTKFRMICSKKYF